MPTKRILPEIAYDRPALRDATARQQLTQQIVSAFEPVIRQNIEQWYQFIPVWQNHKNETKTSSPPQ